MNSVCTSGLLRSDTATNKFVPENLKKTWWSPIYTFFKPDVTLQYHEGQPYHFFACAAEKCKLRVGGMWHFQDSKDKSSTANLKHHVIWCFGEDAVNAALTGKKVQDNSSCSIFSLFAHKGKQPVKHSHHVHTNPEVWYINLYILHKLVFTSIIVHILPNGLLEAIDHLISSTIMSYENF